MISAPQTWHSGRKQNVKTHHYSVSVRWTGNTGTGTSGDRNYERRHEISAETPKPLIPGSSDPAFRGDPLGWNPEELQVASWSACHKLWYLDLCAEAGIVVIAYIDHAEGAMQETARTTRDTSSG